MHECDIQLKWHKKGSEKEQSLSKKHKKEDFCIVFEGKECKYHTRCTSNISCNIKNHSLWFLNHISANKSCFW